MHRLSRVSVLWLWRLCPGLFANAPQTVNALVILHVDIMCKQEPKSISHERCSGNLPTRDLEGFLQISPERAEIAFSRQSTRVLCTESPTTWVHSCCCTGDTPVYPHTKHGVLPVKLFLQLLTNQKKPGRHAVRFTTLIPKMSAVWNMNKKNRTWLLVACIKHTAWPREDCVSSRMLKKHLFGTLHG